MGGPNVLLDSRANALPFSAVFYQKLVAITSVCALARGSGQPISDVLNLRHWRANLLKSISKVCFSLLVDFIDAITSWRRGSLTAQEGIRDSIGRVSADCIEPPAASFCQLPATACHGRLYSANASQSSKIKATTISASSEEAAPKATKSILKPKCLNITGEAISSAIEVWRRGDWRHSPG
jgi:hypothetical protein